ncbi:hypothetical protein M9Y10_006736 [Tritrichomonas musculus]|uniref:Uncharacterized protein n=1 Tax=Tritrichomonas musculus TaxID=1915356 RepID=A0ABR2JF06_9EUKA
MITFLNDSHPQKVNGSIDITEFGIDISLSKAQPLNEYDPMYVTEFGIFICTDDAHSKNE